MKNVLLRLKQLVTHPHVRTAATEGMRVAGTVAGQAQKLGAETLDALTRKNTDDAVREYMLMQSRYNDLLALKLDEALRRIASLEEKNKQP